MKDIGKDSAFIRKHISTGRGRYCSVGMAVLLATSLVACGGGGSSGGGKGGSPSKFSVTSVSPEDGDTGVELDATLKASFNRDLLASSATEDSDRILLKKSSGLQEPSAPVSVGIDTASSLIIQPDTPLDILSEYTVTVTPDITDNSGRPLSDEYHWRFVTRDGDWEQAERLDDGAAPDIAVDGEGNGWAVWLSGDSGHKEVVGRFYSATDGAWSSSNLMFGSPTISVDASKPRIAIDRDTGDAIAVWIQDEKVYARYRDADSAAGPGVDWGAMEQISTATPVYDYSFLKVAFSAGRAMAVWVEEDDLSSATTLVGSTFEPENDPVWREKPGPELELWRVSSGHADFAIDSNGNALLVWLENEPTHPDRDNRVSVSRYDAVTQNWATTSIEMGIGRAYNPKVALDSDGNAFAAWSRSSDDFFGRLYVSRYDVDSGAWDSGRIMGAREESSGRFPSIAVDAQGNAMVAFEAGEPYVAHYTAKDDAWGNARSIGDYGGTVLSDVVVDHDGNAIVVWRKEEGDANARNIFSSRYTAVTDSWGVPKRVETGGGADAERPVISNAGWNHSAITVWEDAGSIYTNRFSAE